MLFWWICGGESVLPVLLLCHLGSSLSFLSKYSLFFIQCTLFICLLSFVYWSILALKCCINFCCTTKWCSYMYAHMYAHIAPSGSSLPLSFIPPIKVITDHRAEFPVLLSFIIEFELHISRDFLFIYISIAVSGTGTK